MGKIVVANQPCIDQVNCKSSDALQIYEEGGSHCFSCGGHFSPAKTAGVEIVTKKSVSKGSKTTVEEIKGFTSRGFSDRKIKKNVCEFFEVKVSYNADGEIDTHYYPYSDGGYKVRKLPKIFSFIGPYGGVFGKDKFTGGGKRIVITEGEVDALSVAQATFDKYNKFYPVISIPSAAGTKEILEIREWIRSFQEVVLCLDKDKAGEEATQKLIKIIGIDKVKLWNPGDCKDANEVLVKYGSEKLYQLIWDAEAYSPAGIIKKEAIWKQIVERRLVPSVPYPPCLDGVNSKIKGMRLGEIVLLISGCLSKGTEVLMFDGTVRRVEDVLVGDLVMGPDSLPRTVLELCRGTEQMVDIKLRDGSGFRCNSSHILTLVNINEDGRHGLKKGDVIDVSVGEYAMWSPKRKHLTKALKSKRLSFKTTDSAHELHPYVLGVWLGDGKSNGAVIYSHEDNIATIEKLQSLGTYIYKGGPRFNYNSPGGLWQSLKRLGVFDNKHIPESYLTASITDRLELLAGLLDTDGHYDNSKNTYEFSQKDEMMILQVERLAMSLGFTTAIGKQKNNRFGNCYRLWISGEGLEDIPVALEYKKARPRLQVKDPNRYSFEIALAGVENYYGFTLSGDGRFVLGNFIVTHNTGAGKSSIAREIVIHLIETTADHVGVISLEESPGETGTKLAGMKIHRNPENEEVPDEELKVGFDALFGDDRIVVLDHQGAVKDESIVSQLEYMCLSGCKYLLIDHITILVSEGSEGLTGNEAIDKIMNDLLRLVKRHNVCIILISHLRKVMTGSKPFEEGRMPTLDDIRGSGSIKQVCFDIIAFTRNSQAEDEVVRNTINMAVLKSRTVGKTGKVPGATYNNNTSRLTGIGGDSFEDVTDKRSNRSLEPQSDAFGPVDAF